MRKECTSNLVDWKNILTEEAKEINLPKQLEYRLLQIFGLYSMTNPLLWFQKWVHMKRKVCISITYLFWPFISSTLSNEYTVFNGLLFSIYQRTIILGLSKYLFIKYLTWQLEALSPSAPPWNSLVHFGFHKREISPINY